MNLTAIFLLHFDVLLVRIFLVLLDLAQITLDYFLDITVDEA